MAEMSREYKILLIVHIIVAFIYGIMYLFLPETVYSVNEAPFFDPHFWRLFGGILFAIGIAGIVGLKMGDWEKVKLLMLYAITFLIILILVNLTSNTYIIRTATNLVFHWLDTTVMIVLLIFDIFFYIREEKK
ncbi:MAG: hypothetical protein EAX89_12460 [Candidatus Lokiarchaeota archaeon]|nr:hypothetical protein [Candidatus Lokiarchaeota archaeon]